MSARVTLFARITGALFAIALFIVTLNTAPASAQEDEGNCSEDRACADDNWTCYLNEGTGCYTGGFCIAVTAPGRIPCCDVEECEAN